MANSPRRNVSSNPSHEGAPSESTANIHNQWVMQTIGELKTSNAKSQEDLIKLITELHNKIDVNHKNIIEKNIENNKSFEEKIKLRHSLLEVKIKSVNDGIESKHTLACEIMKNIEPNILNKINDNQKSFNRWIIGLLVGVLVTAGGILIRVLIK